MTVPVRQDVRIIGQQAIGLDVVIDVFVSEDHSVTLTTTEYPIESGSTVTDHAIRRPASLTLNGAVSALRTRDADIEDIGDMVQPRIPMQTWERLLRAMDDRTLVDVTTLLGVYPNMMIRRAQTMLDRTTGHNLEFTLELRELLLIEEISGLGYEITPLEATPAADRTVPIDQGLVSVSGPPAADAPATDAPTSPPSMPDEEEEEEEEPPEEPPDENDPTADSKPRNSPIPPSDNIKFGLTLLNIPLEVDPPAPILGNEALGNLVGDPGDPPAPILGNEALGNLVGGTTGGDSARSVTFRGAETNINSTPADFNGNEGFGYVDFGGPPPRTPVRDDFTGNIPGLE